jgi:hypothetical protein
VRIKKGDKLINTKLKKGDFILVSKHVGLIHFRFMRGDEELKFPEEIFKPKNNKDVANGLFSTFKYTQENIATFIILISSLFDLKIIKRKEVNEAKEEGVIFQIS